MHICRVQRLAILPQVLLLFFCIRANSEVSSNFQSFYRLLCSHFFLNTSASNPLLKKSPNYFLFRVCLLTLTNNSKFPDHISRNCCTPIWHLCILCYCYQKNERTKRGNSTEWYSFLHPKLCLRFPMSFFFFHLLVNSYLLPFSFTPASKCQ